MDSLCELPTPFWVVICLLVAGGIWAIKSMKDGSGIPALAVLATVTFWYVGDALYNDYAENHVKLFTQSVLNSAWWQVSWFLVAFILLVPRTHRSINSRYLSRSSGLMFMFHHGTGRENFQQQVDRLFLVCTFLWAILFVVASARLGSDVILYLFPFLGQKAEPWGRERLGTGFDALLSLALNLQILVAGAFGILAAISKNRQTLVLSALGCLLTWPYFIFDRTRNTMLAVVIPGILSWVFFRLRGGILKKIAVLIICFCVIDAWLKFVIANRSTMSITAALHQEDTRVKGARHEGLNMYEELCWITTFIEKGTFSPNWGGRYLAELANPIPRALWPGKPMIGIDYSIARGQAGGPWAGSAGVYATISTGMIGQGVVNFGTFLGPPFAAFLMSLWVALLARLDLTADKFGRTPLLVIALILTFNMGRDITLLTLYPFVFGATAILWLERTPLQSLRHCDRRTLQPPF